MLLKEPTDGEIVSVADHGNSVLVEVFSETQNLTVRTMLRVAGTNYKLETGGRMLWSPQYGGVRSDVCWWWPTTSLGKALTLISVDSQEEV